MGQNFYGKRSEFSSSIFENCTYSKIVHIRKLHNVHIRKLYIFENCTMYIRVSWVTPKMSQNFDLMYFNKIEKSHLFANNEQKILKNCNIKVKS